MRVEAAELGGKKHVAGDGEDLDLDRRVGRDDNRLVAREIDVHLALEEEPLRAGHLAGRRLDSAERPRERVDDVAETTGLGPGLTFGGDEDDAHG